MRFTEVEPDTTQLAEMLQSYGHPKIHVPLATLRADVTPWEVSVSLMFTDLTQQDYLSPVDWCKRILDRIEVMTEGMREIGWIIHGRMSIKFDSRFDPPTCTLGQKLVKSGEEWELTASTDFVVLPVTGELIELWTG